MSVLQFKNPYDPSTDFGKRLQVSKRQKAAIAEHIAKRFALHGDLALFIADGTTAAFTFRALVNTKEYPTRIVTNNLDVLIQYTCVAETRTRMHEPIPIQGSLDRDANALFPRWGYEPEELALESCLKLCDVVILGASYFTWANGPRSRHCRRQVIRKQILRNCQDRTIILVLPSPSFFGQDPQYGDEPAWMEWKNNPNVLRHLHVVTCVPEPVPNEHQERIPFRGPIPPDGVQPPDWGYVKETDALRDAIEERLVEINTGDWRAAQTL